MSENVFVLYLTFRHVPLIRLGKLLLRWCVNCNLPILEQEQCSRCSGPTVNVKITPPGDVRPAFGADIDILRNRVNSQFGKGKGRTLFPDDKVVILNKVPHLDRMDEVILDGRVLGSLRYDPGKGYLFVLRMEGGRRLARGLRKGLVMVHDGAVASISRKASAMIPGILMADPSIRKGDEVVVVSEDGRAIAVGIARTSGREMMTGKRGPGAKTRWASTPADARTLPGGQSWKDVLEANDDVLTRRSRESINFIRRTSERYDLPVVVSFSGGKDSLATLLLVLDAGLKPDILFVDTGLEFNETVNHVEEVSREFGLRLVQASAGNSFWEQLDFFGPPAKDYRWCCKTCKLGPAARLIKEKYPDGVLSFIGQRRYESEQRAAKDRVWKNPWVPLQIGASPIQDWTSLHIWLYLFKKGVVYNPWYENGLERIGCWLCPASDLAEVQAVKSRMPGYVRWERFLYDYARRTGWSKEWVDYGGWRWKLPPKPMRRLLGEKKSDERPGDPYAFFLSQGYSPCMGGLSAEGIFSSSLNIRRVRVFLNLVGEVEFDDTVRACITEKVIVFEEGVAIIKAKEEKELHETSRLLERIVRKAHSCVGCGTCLGQCPLDAIYIDGVAWIDEERCSHCGSCAGPCPVADFQGEYSF